MSLRLQIRQAIDEVSPPPVALERRVGDFVFKADVRRTVRPHSNATYTASRFKGFYALVAAVLVVALAGGLILVGRIERDLSNPPAAVNQAGLAGLEATPWRTATLAPGAPCPETAIRYVDPFPMLVGGRGPFYMAYGGGVATTGWGAWMVLQFVYPIARPLHGPVLLRAKDLKNPAALMVFGAYPLGPDDLVPAGRVIGTDSGVDPPTQMRTEAVVQPPFKTNIGGQTPNLRIYMALQKGGSGCMGLQIDGPDGVSDGFVIDFPPPWTP